MMEYTISFQDACDKHDIDITNLENISDDDKWKLIKESGLYIEYLDDNLSEEQKLWAVKQTSTSILHIKNPSKDMLIHACSYNPILTHAMQRKENYTRDVFFEILKRTEKPIYVLSYNVTIDVDIDMLLLILDNNWYSKVYEILEKNYPKLLRKYEFRREMNKLKIKNGCLQ